ncbi:MAG: hypothetical protein LBU94_00660, partial [Clostridiales bacterium]|nr:hypothetical protein [Clostridiales bacterium]
MAAFELNSFSPVSGPSAGINVDTSSRRDTKVENAITFKIYDIARQQNCLDYSEIGPARAAQSVVACGRQINEG